MTFTRRAPRLAVVVAATAIAGCGSPPAAPVPDVTGMTVERATVKLEHAGYDVDVDDQSDTLDFKRSDNTVCATRPTAGSRGEGDVVLVAKSDPGHCGRRVGKKAAANGRDGDRVDGTPARGKEKVETRTEPPKPRAGIVLAALDELQAKGRAPKTGYDREQFGAGWASIDGCDTRQRILARDLDQIAYAGGSDCEIASGVLSDPYTATRIQFFRGGASEVDIDHVVALGDAWQKGAQQWSYTKRVQFANDPLNLLSSDASANRQKSDSDAASWVPSNKPFRCAYIARQIAVKRRYNAWVTGAEKEAMARVLARCPGQKLPTARRLRIPVPPEPAPEPTPQPKSSGSGAVKARYFENCDAVRAAGMAPLSRGDGVYEQNTHMDRDGDGVACE
jgi:hypothetical protein